jgi:RNA polymerase sigma-70 factor (ECF subfamily)
MAGRLVAEPTACVELADIEALYRTYARKCHALALHIVRDPHLAQDVVQEVFSTAFRERHRFDPSRGSVSTWLTMLTHNKAVDLVRARHSRTRLDRPEELAAAVADISIGPADEVCRDDEGRSVRAALRSLHNCEREVIVLAYFEGYTQSQIAALLAIPLGTVKSRSLRALRQLAALLEERPQET